MKTHRNSTSQHSDRHTGLIQALVLGLGLLLGLAPRAAWAQATANPPERMSYQGYLVDANGGALGTNAPKNYDVIFRIWNDQNATAAGNRLWAEQQTVTVDKGYFSVLLGEGSQYASEPHGNLSTVFLAADASERYVEFTVKGIGSGGADVTILPRLKLLSSPYALLARNAITAVSATTVDGSAVATGTVPDGRLSSNVALRNGGNTFNGDQYFTAGNLLMDNSKILYAKNAANGYEPFLWPRFSDNVTYLNFGVNGFNVRNNSSASIMFLQNNGNVGIGTTAPAYPLDVNGIGRFSGGVQIGSGINTGFYGDGANIALRTYTGGAIYFQTVGGGTTPMYISPAGNVGVGTITPGSKFTDKGNLEVDTGNIYMDNSYTLNAKNASGNYETVFWPRWTDNVTYLNYGANGLNIRNNSSTPVMFMNSGGSVGIGNTSPSTKLDVTGGITMDDGAGHYVELYRSSAGLVLYGNNMGNPNNAGGIGIAQWDGDSNLDGVSDQSLKKDIAQAEPVLDRVMQLQVRRFHWKNAGEDAPKTFGVIAQEVKPLFPDSVGSLTPPPGTLPQTNALMTVKYATFGLIAVKALQEFKQQEDGELKQLQEQLAGVEKENQRLLARDKAREDRLSALEALVEKLSAAPQPVSPGLQPRK